MIRLKHAVLLVAIGLSGGGATVAAPAKNAAAPATIIKDRRALEKLLGNQGTALQWISWQRRGTLDAHWKGKTLYLSGGQKAADSAAEMRIDGVVVSIDKNRFIFRGTITINDTPDAGRRCTKTGDSEFGITQGRKYWRLREFEWCDSLTDYVDIYF
jgi:hypothetical protein